MIAYDQLRGISRTNSHHYSHQPIQDGNGVKRESAKLLKDKEKRSGADEN